MQQIKKIERIYNWIKENRRHRFTPGQLKQGVVPREYQFKGWQTFRSCFRDFTPLMAWIYYHHQQIPNELFYSGWQTDRSQDGSTPLMLFIEYNRHVKYIPKYFLYNNYRKDRNNNGETPLMIWLRTRPNQQVPDELFYKDYGLDTDKRGNNPLMIFMDGIWYNRVDIDIPKSFFYKFNPRQRNVYGETPIMSWIKYMGEREYINQNGELITIPSKPIPKELYYPNFERDEDQHGQKPLRQWIENRPNEEIPKELYYEGCQTERNFKGETPIMSWIEYCDQPFPEQLFYPNWQKDVPLRSIPKDVALDMDYTPLMLWMSFHLGETIPDILFYPGCIFDVHSNKTTIQHWADLIEENRNPNIEIKALPEIMLKDSLIL